MDIKENVISWEEDYDWSCGGEEWSDPWGSSSSQWFNVIYPRIHSYLPAAKILEIAIGHGRWTNYLKEYTGDLVGVDLAEKCVKFCRERFINNKGLSFYKTNGTDLSMVEDASIDFIFSFDSLVHADFYIIKSYLAEMNRILKDGGTSFIHHSNLQDCLKVEGLLAHARSCDVSHQDIKEFSNSIGLNCVIQELVNWRNPKEFMIDCFSTFIKNNPDEVVEYKLFKNDKFMEQAQHIKTLSAYYK